MEKDRKVSEKKNVFNVCSLRRVTRVTKGGKAMRFSGFVVGGNENGMVGYGMGRSVEVAEAIKKASRSAEMKFMRVKFKDKRTIFHDVYGEFCGSKVYLRSAKPGRGRIAGGSMRFIFEALGIKDIVCKSVGSPNAQNVVKATFNALKKLKTPKEIAALRGVEISRLFAPINKTSKKD